jgi:hypothetical protein
MLPEIAPHRIPTTFRTAPLNEQHTIVGLRFVSQKIANLTVLAAQSLFEIFSTLFTIPMRTSDRYDGSNGLFLSLEKGARWSSIESHFSDCISQKFLNPGEFSRHRPPLLTRNISRSKSGKHAKLKLDPREHVVIDLSQTYAPRATPSWGRFSSESKTSVRNCTVLPTADPRQDGPPISSRGSRSNAFRPENMAETIPPPSRNSVTTTAVIWITIAPRRA